MADLLDVVKGAATLALITFAVRWLNTAKGSDSPTTHGEVAVYGVRWPVRVVAYAAAVLFLVLAFVDLRPDFASGRWPVNVLCVMLAFGAAWFGTGVVTLDQNTISKKFLWRSSSLEWEEICEVKYHKRDGGAIELRGNGKKLIVDSRFVAPAHLRREIEQRTKLQPVTD